MELVKIYRDGSGRPETVDRQRALQLIKAGRAKLHKDSRAGMEELLAAKVESTKGGPAAAGSPNRRRSTKAKDKDKGKGAK